MSQMGAERRDDEQNDAEEDMGLNEALSFEVACLEAMFGDGNWFDYGRCQPAQYS